MDIYKYDTPLNIVKDTYIEFQTKTNFSEPNGMYKMIGLRVEYSKNREVCYLFPSNSNGTNDRRWMSIEKKDIPELIKVLEEINNL